MVLAQKRTGSFQFPSLAWLNIRDIKSRERAPRSNRSRKAGEFILANEHVDLLRDGECLLSLFCYHRSREIRFKRGFG